MTQHPTRLQGEEIDGIQLHGLDIAELDYLRRYGEGQEPSDDIHSRGAIREMERSIKRKLGAKNRAHMISRAFLLGVLVPAKQATCGTTLALMIFISLQITLMHDTGTENPMENSDQQELLRIGRVRNSRTGRSGRNQRNSRRAPLEALIEDQLS